MKISEAKKLLTDFLMASEGEVISWFAELPGAVVPKQRDYTFIPGTRKDRILLVAHADTVAGRLPQDAIMWLGDVAVRSGGRFRRCTYGGGALGADDRAGCAALWSLREFGHSLLITTGEESGLKGARAATIDLREELKKHVFAVEVDRRGDHQVVFYDVATNDFKEYIIDGLNDADPKEDTWEEQPGSSTDIRLICDSTGICGANLSAGYMEEHTGGEMLLLGAWLNTVNALGCFLEVQPHEPFRFAAKTLPRPIHTPQAGSWEGGRWKDSRSSTQPNGMGTGLGQHRLHGASHAGLDRNDKTRQDEDRRVLNELISDCETLEDIKVAVLLPGELFLSKNQRKLVLAKLRGFVVRGIATFEQQAQIMSQLESREWDRRQRRKEQPKKNDNGKDDESLHATQEEDAAEATRLVRGVEKRLEGADKVHSLPESAMLVQCEVLSPSEFDLLDDEEESVVRDRLLADSWLKRLTKIEPVVRPRTSLPSARSLVALTNARAATPGGDHLPPISSPSTDAQQTSKVEPNGAIPQRPIPTRKLLPPAREATDDKWEFGKILM